MLKPCTTRDDILIDPGLMHIRGKPDFAERITFVAKHMFSHSNFKLISKKTKAVDVSYWRIKREYRREIEMQLQLANHLYNYQNICLSIFTISELLFSLLKPTFVAMRTTDKIASIALLCVLKFLYYNSCLGGFAGA